MADWPTKDSVMPTGASNMGPVRAGQRQQYDAVRQLPGARALSELTIDAGSVTPSQGIHSIDTEGDDPADTLTHIDQTNLPDGSLLIIMSADNGRVPTVDHGAGGTGQILLADSADLALAHTSMRLVLRRAGAAWVEEGRFYGNQLAAMFAWIKQVATTTLTGVVEKSTSGENITGTATDKFPDVAGVKEMIDTHAAGEDQVARDLAMQLAWEMLELKGAAIEGFGNMVADAFETADGIDAAASTNETYDPSADLYHNPGSQAEVSYAGATNIGNMNGGGGLAAAWDNDTNQASGASQVNAGSGYNGWSWSAPKTISGARTWGRNDAGYTDGGASVTLAVYGKNGSAPGSVTDGTVVATIVAGLADANNANPQEKLTGFVATAYDHSWVAITGGSGAVYLAEAELLETTPPPNMTLVSNAMVAASAPASIRMMVEIDDTAAPVAGTDLKLELTRDDGTTWTEVGSYADHVRTGSNRIVKGTADVSAQPTGTDVRCRLRTFNNKHIPVKQWAVMADVELAPPA